MLTQLTITKFRVIGIELLYLFFSQLLEQINNCLHRKIIKRFNDWKDYHSFFKGISKFQLSDVKELARYVYFGGVKVAHLRPLVWMYLLGHYPPDSTREERVKIDQDSANRYNEIRAVDEDIKKVDGF